MSHRYLAGIDIGGTKCAVIVGTDEPRILRKRNVPTDHYAGATPMVERLCTELSDAFREEGIATGDVEGIGISCGGPLDPDEGLILSPPNLPEWDRIPVVEIVRRRFGRPAVLRNDADACALAEWRWGAGRGTRSMVFLTFGTGMGAGLILDGRLYRGPTGSAGEVGHLRLAPDGPEGYGKRGSFEGFCSGGGIARLAQERVGRWLDVGRLVAFCPSRKGLPEITARSVIEAAKAGDAAAREIIDESASYLGMGLSILVDLLNPERIVIGSIFLRAEALFRPGMEAVLDRETLNRPRRLCSVVPAGLGEEVGDYGAIGAAMEGME